MAFLRLASSSVNDESVDAFASVCVRVMNFVRKKGSACREVETYIREQSVSRVVRIKNSVYVVARYSTTRREPVLLVQLRVNDRLNRLIKFLQLGISSGVPKIGDSAEIPTCTCYVFCYVSVTSNVSQVTCSPGYVTPLEPVRKPTCRENGIWSAPPPPCRSYRDV